LSRLDKVLYPASGFTKGEVIDYYTRVAPVLLLHLRDRPVTFVRWPDGVAGQSWFGKNVPKGAPSWLRTVSLPSSGSREAGEVTDYPGWTTCPRWCGRRTLPLWNSMCRSGQSGHAGRGICRICWCSTSIPCAMPWRRTG
jgi:hypothetical protein